MFEVTRPPPAPRVARAAMIERAPGSECACATKSPWPPMPLITRPSSSASDEAAPSSVSTSAVLTKRASRRCAILARVSPRERIREGDRGHRDLGEFGRRAASATRRRSCGCPGRSRHARGPGRAPFRRGASERRRAATRENHRPAFRCSHRGLARTAPSSAPSAAALAEPGDQRAKLGVARVPQDERVAQRIGERADADLQRAAVLDHRRRMQRHRVVGERYGLFRRREQIEMRSRWIEHDIEVATAALRPRPACTAGWR